MTISRDARLDAVALVTAAWHRDYAGWYAVIDNTDVHDTMAALADLTALILSGLDAATWSGTAGSDLLDIVRAGALAEDAP